MNIQQHKELRSWNTNHPEVQQCETQSNNSFINQTQTTISTKGDTTMKNTKMFSRIGVAMVIALLISSVQFSSAAGTAAGTAITNTASVTFNDGANVKNKTSNTVTMYVGHKVAAAFTPASDSLGTYDNVTYYRPIEITNQGNRTTPFTVSFNSPTGYTLTLIDDDNQDGIHQSGEVTPVTTTTSIAADGSRKYFIKADLGTIANGTTDNIIVTFTNAAVDDGGNNIVVLNPSAAFSFTLKSTIVKPVISFAVSGTAPSPLIPGAEFNFGITLDNTGSATPYSYDLGTTSSSVVRLQYTVPTNFSFTGGASGTFALSPSGTVSYEYSGGIVTMYVDTSYLEPADAAISFTLPIIIDQSQNNSTGPASGASINSSAGSFGNLNYSSPQNQLPVTASTSGTIFTGAVTVATSKGGKWTVTPANDSSAAGETSEYVLTLKNMGNLSATFKVTDVDASGNVVVDHIVAESTNGTDLGAGNTASVSAGSTIQIYVRLTIPGIAAVSDSIKRQISVSSNATGTLWTGVVGSDTTHTITTTVIAATFNITLAAESIGGLGTTTNPAPGDTITFALTIANTGGTNVTSVVISNLIPTNMSFVANGFAVGNGIRIDAVNQSNANDGDDAHYDAAGNGTVKTNSTFSVNAGITKVLRYKCTVN
jgi:uncharacterized repeat protein (TIGR01451 family)